MRKKQTTEIVLCGMFVALITAGAFIKIPVPLVPFTLQYLFTMLAGLLLGAKSGFIAVTVYILLGLIGFPVFSSGGGIGYVLEPTFGYIIGFAVGAFVTGWMAHQTESPGYLRLLAANFTGLLIVYLFGMVYYELISWVYLGRPIDLWSLIWFCFILAVPGDILLCIIAAVLGKRLIPILQKEKLKYVEEKQRGNG